MSASERQRPCQRRSTTFLVLLLLTPGLALAQKKLLEYLPEVLSVASASRELARQEAPVSGLEIQRRAYGVVDQGAITQDLRGILDQLQRGVTDAPDASIYVTPDPSLTAFTAPDGTILIAAGALESMGSRDEVAALVAHEYAHVLLGHHKKFKMQEAARKAYGIGATYLTLRFGDYSEADLKSVAVKQATSHALALGAIQLGVLPAYSRRQELEADARAVDLLVAAQFNPVANFDLLDRLAVWEDVQETTRQNQKVALVSLKEELSKSRNLDEAMMVVLMGSMINAMNVSFNALDKGLRKVARNHQGAGKRSAELRKHLESRYAGLDRTEYQAVPWEGRKPTIAMFAGLTALHGVMGAIDRGDEGALRSLLPLARSSPASRTAYGRFVLLRAQLSGGAPSLKERQAMWGEQQKPDSLYASHFLILDSTEKVAGTHDQLEALEASRRSLNDPPELMPYSIAIYSRAGKHPNAASTLARCRGFGDAGLLTLCQERAKKS